MAAQKDAESLCLFSEGDIKGEMLHNNGVRIRRDIGHFYQMLMTYFVVVASLAIILPFMGVLDIPFLAYLYDAGKSSQSQSECDKGSFLLHGMSWCHPWLDCADIESSVLITDKVLGSGGEKLVKEGSWQSHPIAVNILQREDFIDDFKHNLAMLQLFNKHPGAQASKFVQLVGWCLENTPVILTELHPLGSANQVHSVLGRHFPQQDTLKTRFKLCLELAQIIDILHSHPNGTRVMCDANDPNKALSQFLLTEDFGLVLNDMDALPRVDKENGEFIKCGHRELHGDFVAPEQLWPFENQTYDDELMPHYDEKVDIWKIPDICNALIGDVQHHSKLQLYLFNIHSKCKNTIPHDRPTAKEVLEAYQNIYKKLKSQNEPNTCT